MLLLPKLRYFVVLILEKTAFLKKEKKESSLFHLSVAYRQNEQTAKSMNAFSFENGFVEQEQGGSVGKKQAEFVRFLVNAYYIKPNILVDEAKRLAHPDASSRIAFRDFTFNDETALAVGRIAEAAKLLDDKHVQEKPPFSVVEKPLLIPAMIGALVKSFFFEEYGVFISSTTFEVLASRSCGFAMHLSRVWLDAEYRVQQALLRSTVSRFASTRTACETGLYTIKLQSRKTAPLHSLWGETYRLLCNKLHANSLEHEAAETLFSQAIKSALDLRKKVDACLRESSSLALPAINVLYSVAEPELCACVAYHACYCKLEKTFKKVINSGEKKRISAAMMQVFFHGCLNSFTFNRYDSEKAQQLFETLDAVAALAVNKRAAPQQNLMDFIPEVQPTYLQRTQPICCDSISGEVVPLLTSTKLRTSVYGVFRLMELDTSTIKMGAMYPFASEEPGNY